MRAACQPHLRARSLAALMLCFALGATPATNPAAAGKFDDVALRAGPAPAKPGEKSSVNGASATFDGFNTRRVALSLAGVISLILLLRFALRRFLPQTGSAKSGGPIRVLSRTMIAPKQHVILLQIGRRIVVVGDCATQMNSLAEITDPDEIASLQSQIDQDKVSSTVSRAFGGLFQSARQPFDEASTSDQERVPQNSPESVETADLSGLTEKIRLLSSQFRRGAP